MSHSAMYNLAHCQLVGNVASGALWMPMGNPANAFRSDFPVEGRPHSIGKPNTSLCSLSISIHTGMPGIYTWASIRTGEQKGSHHTGAKKRWVVIKYIFGYFCTSGTSLVGSTWPILRFSQMLFSKRSQEQSTNQRFRPSSTPTTTWKNWTDTKGGFSPWPTRRAGWRELTQFLRSRTSSPTSLGGLHATMPDTLTGSDKVTHGMNFCLKRCRVNLVRIIQTL